MAAVKTAVSVISAVSNPAGGGPQVGTLSLSVAYGATLTVRSTNGGTGPTVPITTTINVSNDNSTWRQFAAVTSGVTASEVDDFVFQIPPTVMYVQVSAGGNTGQAVTIECLAQVLTSI